MPDTPCASAACEGWCEVAGSQTACELGAGHEYEHEATHEVEVFDAAGSGTLTNFLVWWGDDGHAFVGSDKAVDTGKIT